jgi:hypothetical protein
VRKVRNRKRSDPSIKRIVAGQQDLLKKLKVYILAKHYGGTLDLATATGLFADSPTEEYWTFCWACGRDDERVALERAHIEAHWSGGSNQPDNYLLLCPMCHQEQPDEAPKEAQLEWLRNRDGWRVRFWEETWMLVNALLAVDKDSMAQFQNHLFEEVGDRTRFQAMIAEASNFSGNHRRAFDQLIRICCDCYRAFLDRCPDPVAGR